MSKFELRFTDEEGQTASGAREPDSGGKHRVESLDGAEGHGVGCGSGNILGARIYYIDICQCNGTGDFAQERGFLLIGLDQGEANFGSPDFYGEGGESGAGADVEEVAGG